MVTSALPYSFTTFPDHCLISHHRDAGLGFVEMQAGCTGIATIGVNKEQSQSLENS